MNLATKSFENPVLPPCRIANELDYLAKATRTLVCIGDTPRRSAAAVRAIVAVNRKRHHHTAKCDRCLLHEAIASAAYRPQQAVVNG
jgi:hypothetical protein